MTKKVRILAEYSRVSDDESAKKKDGSLTSQEHIGKEIAERQTRVTGIPHVIEYVLTEKQGVSGGNTDRPQFQVLWDLITAGRIDGVAAKDIARLNRSLLDFCELMDHCRKHGVSVFINNLDIDPNSPFGDMIFKLLALIAEFERTLGVQRTRDGIRAGMLHKNKIHGGRVLLGFDRVESGRWTPNKEELTRVDRILTLIPQYDGYPAACRAIAVEGITNKYGGEITKDCLRRMVFSRKYEGINEVRVAVGPPVKHSRDIKREKIAERPIGCGPVVDLQKLNSARTQLAVWDSLGNKTRKRSRVNFLVGLLQYEDGSEFKGDGGTARNGVKIAYYKNKKNGISVRAEEIEQKVLEAVACYQNDEEVQGYVGAAVRQFSQGIEAITAQIGSLRNDLAKLKEREKNLGDALVGMPAERVKAFLEAQLQEIDEQKRQAELGTERLERERTALQRDLPNTKDMRATLEFVFKNFDKAEDSVKRNFMRKVFEKIVIYRDNRVGLFWRFPEITKPAPSCDSGGRGFGLSLKWGNRRGLLRAILALAPPLRYGGLASLRRKNAILAFF